MISFLFIPIFKSAHYNYCVDLLIISDIYTNALCIFLSYKRFGNIYYFICGGCDRHCARKCVEYRDWAKVDQHNIHSQQSTKNMIRVSSESTQ